MPYLKVRLNESQLTFSVSRTTEDWSTYFGGSLVGDLDDPSFTVKKGTREYDAIGAEVRVYIKKRPPINELPKIPTSKPWDSADEHRDRILVLFPEDSDEKLRFEISASLPPEAYQRIVDIDWNRHTLVLGVDLSASRHSEQQILTYANAHDVSEVLWLADVQQYLFIEGLTVHFWSPPTSEARDAE